jgi:bifunctional UDP-N-acetylglucosamine pyrophosphorylase/glucosamine-1-phosphate N-acetyltransferase/UDP-N-acetylglucosamine pyrophosphorylase
MTALLNGESTANMAASPIAIILAAGKGKRMGSDLPKVLLSVCGRPMIRYVVDAVRAAGIEQMVVVVGHRAELVKQELSAEPSVKFVAQTEQLGTGHAVMMCREVLAMHDGPVLILAGDSPMVQVSSLRAVLAEFAAERPACMLGTATKSDPTGLGRVVRDSAGNFHAIVEEKDATPTERAVTEVNMSTYVFQAADLLWALNQLTANNAQSEYYLTDCPGVLKSAGKKVVAVNVLQPCEALSINTPAELQAVEVEMKKLNR